MIVTSNRALFAKERNMFSSLKLVKFRKIKLSLIWFFLKLNIFYVRITSRKIN